MRDADEDEGGDDDVEDGVVGYEHENAVSVVRHPDVILSNEQLKQARMRTALIDTKRSPQSHSLLRAVIVW